MTSDQADKIIKLLEAIDFKLWKFYEQAGLAEQPAAPTPTPAPAPAAPAPKPPVSKALYEQFVKNKKWSRSFS